MCHDPLPGRDPSVEKRCTKALLYSNSGPTVLTDFLIVTRPALFSSKKAAFTKNWVWDPWFKHSTRTITSATIYLFDGKSSFNLPAPIEWESQSQWHWSYNSKIFKEKNILLGNDFFWQKKNLLWKIIVWSSKWRVKWFATSNFTTWEYLFLGFLQKKYIWK